MSNNKLKVDVNKVKAENLFDSQKEPREFKNNTSNSNNYSNSNSNSNSNNRRNNNNNRRPQDNKRKRQ